MSSIISHTEHGRKTQQPTTITGSHFGHEVKGISNLWPVGTQKVGHRERDSDRETEREREKVTEIVTERGTDGERDTERERENVSEWEREGERMWVSERERENVSEWKREEGDNSLLIH